MEIVIGLCECHMVKVIVTQSFKNCKKRSDKFTPTYDRTYLEDVCVLAHIT